MEINFIFLFLLFTIALLYSIIGHGGASGYIALMIIFSTPFVYIKPMALVLNIVVSALGFVMYFSAGHFKPKLFWPLIITSVPSAFLGGLVKIDQPVIHLILAFALLFSSYQLLFRRNTGAFEECTTYSIHYFLNFYYVE